MKKILVPVDFSQASRSAVVYAGNFVKAFQAEIILLHAYMEPLVLDTESSVFAEAMTEMQTYYGDLMHKEKAFFTNRFSVDVQGEVTRGYASNAVCAFVKENNIDLVIIGLKDAGKPNTLTGNTVTSLVHSCAVPVMVIPQSAVFTGIQRITFAADFNAPKGISVMQALILIVQKFDACVEVVHVQKNETVMEPQEIAGKISTNMLLNKCTHNYHTVEDSNVEHGIKEFISKHPTDLLVMIAHHHNLFERLFRKTAAVTMLYETPIPVLVLHDN